MAKYDINGKLVPDNSFTTEMGLLINQCFVNTSANNPNKFSTPAIRKNGIKDIIGTTTHNTPDIASVLDDGEQYTRATINGAMGGVYVNYYVDEVCAWWNLPDEYGNWSCADGSGDGNTKTIAIECIMDGTGSAADLKAQENCAKLVAYLHKKYNLPSSAVYTHTYWINKKFNRQGTDLELKTKNLMPWVNGQPITGQILNGIVVKVNDYKLCPYYITPNWSDYIKQIEYYYNQSGNTPLTPQETESYKEYDVIDYLIKVNVSKLNVRQNHHATSQIVTTIAQGEVYTIVRESVYDNGDKWGQLKSGGWISLSYVEKYNPHQPVIPSIEPYLVVITDPDPNGLNVRKSPNINSAIVTTVKKGGVYTIIEESEDWGLLKSGVGWISLRKGYSEKYVR